MTDPPPRPGQGPEPAPREPDPQADRQHVDALDKRLKAARGTAPQASQSSGMSHRQTGIAYRVLVDMIAGLLVGGFLGYWLDRWLGWTPYAMLTGLVLGFVAGVNNAWRAIRAYQEDATRGESDRRLP